MTREEKRDAETKKYQGAVTVGNAIVSLTDSDLNPSRMKASKLYSWIVRWGYEYGEAGWVYAGESIAS